MSRLLLPVIALFAELSSGCSVDSATPRFPEPADASWRDAAKSEGRAPSVTPDAEPPVERPPATPAPLNDGATAASADAKAPAAPATPSPSGTLPGRIEGVEPESHAPHPPMVDRNGHLYRVTETPESDGNRPRMMKSLDGGSTWSEAHAEGRPRVSDLEGCWTLQTGATIHYAISKGTAVYVAAFNTSDAASNPDRWVMTEQVDSGLSSSGVKQFASITLTSDGALWVFYSDKKAGDHQQIAYRRRMGPNSYGPKMPVEGPSGSWTAPVTVLGKDDVTHLFYKDHLAGRLLWRTLSPAGVLSPPTRIDAGGTSKVAIPHTNAVVWQRNGQEVVTIAYSNMQGLLRIVDIVDGMVQPEQALSSTAVLQNPPVTLNEAAVANLALDEGAVHALWVEASSGDIKRRVRSDAGAWSVESVVWNSGNGEAHYVYPNVFVRGGQRILGFTYDKGPHPDDTGDIRYDQILLGPASSASARNMRSAAENENAEQR